MPKCMDCGNHESFCSSSFPPVAPTANGPISSLVATFTDGDYIDEMESLGADIDQAQEAWESPEEYFDTCYQCGSKNIEW